MGRVTPRACVTRLRSTLQVWWQATGGAENELRDGAAPPRHDAAAPAGDKFDEVTLRLLGSYELLFEDYPAAEKAWGGLVTSAPKDKDIQTNKAWLAYSQLMQF